MADTKKTILVGLAGCGCLVLAGLVILAAVAVMGVAAVDQTLEQNGLGGISEIKDTFDSLTPEPGEKEAQAKADAIREKLDPEGIDPKLLAEEATKPLTKEDVDNYLQMMKALEDSEAMEQVNSGFESLKKQGSKTESKDVLEQMRSAKGAIDTYSGASEVFKEFDRQVVERGGYNAYYGRLMRISGAIAAAEANKSGEIWSDASAAKTLAAQPAARKEFEAAFAKLEKAWSEKDAAKNQDAQVGISTLMAPDKIALARFPKTSFEYWKSLGADRRKELVDWHQRKDGAWALLSAGNLTRGDAMLVISEMKKLDRFKKTDGSLETEAK